ncbi:MAG TPA: pyridoxamine 5'-phosphate oxidase family protein [Thermoanaerobaculia bacterium]
MSEQNTEIEKLYGLIEDLDTAMLTTRREDGRLVSRPMANQSRAAGADLWFVTEKTSDKVHEIANDPHVNLAYYKDRTREWVSVAGTARLVEDRAKIRELYRPDWKIWFSKDGLPGDERAGTAEDPRMVLIGVRAELATWMTVNKPQPLVLLEIVKGAVTGKEPRLGDMHHAEGAALHSGPRKPEKSA